MTDTNAVRERLHDLKNASWVKVGMWAETVIPHLCDELDALRKPVEVAERPNIENVQRFVQGEYDRNFTDGTVDTLCDYALSLESALAQKTAELVRVFRLFTDYDDPCITIEDLEERFQTLNTNRIRLQEEVDTLKKELEAEREKVRELTADLQTVIGYYWQPTEDNEEEVVETIARRYQPPRESEEG